MTRRILLILVALGFLFSFFALRSWLQTATATEDEPSAQLLVKYRSSLRKPTAGGQVVDTIDGIGIRVIQYDSREEAEQAAEVLEQYWAVDYAEVNRPSVQILSAPADPKYNSQWHLPKISAPVAWDHRTGEISTLIAVIDTGVYGAHPDLVGKVLGGKSFVGPGAIDLPANSDSDPCGHGTAVAGLAAAQSNNGVGVAGVDWFAQILPIRVIDTSTGCQFGFIEDLVEAIQYAADAGAKIINVSLGTSENSQALRDAVVYAKNKGAIVVAAAGNSSSVLYPAAFSEAIAVGASNQDDVVAAFSASGGELDLVAPGVSVMTTCDPGGADLSCNTGDPYATLTGTSASAPIVAGAFGLALARNPGMIGSDFLTAAQGGVDKVGGMGGAHFTNGYGYGRLNVYKLLWAFQDYHAHWVSQSSYPSIPRGSAHQFTVNFKNSGKSTWVRDDPFFPMNLGTDRTRDRTPGFIREGSGPSGWRKENRIALLQSSVPPNQIGTFSFWYTAPPDKEFGIFREYFRPVADGWDWLEDYGVYWDVTVPTIEEQYRHVYITQNPYPVLKRGQSYQFTVTVRNTGGATWQKGIVNLGTDRSRDRVPEFLREDRQWGNSSGWLKENRIAMRESSVPPDKTATFEFFYTVPHDKEYGTFRDYFRVVADGIAWMEDYGIYWDITVVP